jgi:glycerate kinase
MTHWAALLGRSADGRSAAVALGSGAGGGLGAALIRLGARRVPGIGTVLEAADIAGLIHGVDLVITGGGSFDWQSLRGKVVAGVAAAALERAVPVVVLAGQVEVSRREWITAGVAASFPAAAEPGESHHEGVARAAARAARTWSRS